MGVAALIGGPLSPYVRKVVAVYCIKGVSFRIDPIIPFQGNDAFTAISPLRRVPVFIDDQVTLSDSTVIGVPSCVRRRSSKRRSPSGS